MVSSVSVTSSSPTSTMSGQAEVTKMFSGMVDIGLSFDRIPGRSAYIFISPSRCALMPLTRAMRAESCCEYTFLAVMPQSTLKGCGEW